MVTGAVGTTNLRTMLGHQPLVTSISEALTRLRDWPVTAQQQARRNAMIAATASTQRRIEREEVADFLRSQDQPVATEALTEDEVRAAAARAHG